MNIEQYDKTIGVHLHTAREYAYRCAREFSRMPARPAFFTLAEDELAKAEQDAEQVLAAIRAAKQAIETKATVESGCAA